MLCYDPEGNQYDKDPVDVWECIKYAGYTQEPPVEHLAVDAQAKKTKVKPVDNAELSDAANPA